MDEKSLIVIKLFAPVFVFVSGRESLLKIFLNNSALLSAYQKSCSVPSPITTSPKIVVNCSPIS